ncbi:MAG: gliding motility-associated C-terminal domain-containing protein [Saprospiraceae bacterium]|nr:gliding motility-associated C-terminal domain-containing protein [Saprospiraceae bacterium]
MLTALCLTLAGAAMASPDTLAPSITLLASPICEGDTVWVNGNAYHAGRPLGTEVIRAGAANGCDSIIQVNLEPIPSPFFVLTDTLCPGDMLTVNGTTYDQNNPNGLETMPGASFLGCDSLILVDLQFWETWAYAGPDGDAVIGDQICFDARFGQAVVSFAWSPPPPCPFSPECGFFCETKITPAELTYALTALDSNGCVLRDSVTIRVNDNSRVYVPNVFSPQAQEPNDRVYVFTDRSVLRIRQFWIADRWGEIVFQEQDILPNAYSAGWDGTFEGKNMPPGVYLYFLELERIDGSFFTVTGSVTLL